MTITRKITSFATAAALAATALGPLATSASAEGWRDGRRGGPDYAYSRSERRDWDGDRHDSGRYRYAHRHRHHDNTGKYIALGVGALMLGIIASEAARH
jgi:Ni/Co efflux regulator RcnB